MNTEAKPSRRKRFRTWAKALFSNKSASRQKHVPHTAPQPTATAQKQAPIPKPIRQPPLPEDIACEFRKNGLDPTDYDILCQRYPLSWACATGRIDLVETILTENPRHPYLCATLLWDGVGTTPEREHKTPFGIALEREHFDIARLLLKHGAEAKYVRDVTKISAVCGEDTDLMELVMRDTFTTKPKEGFQPFRTAIKNGECENARALLRYGASTGYNERTKDRMVRECGRDMELMWTVLQQTLPVDETNPDARILALRVWVLIFAMQRQNFNCVNLLWERGGCREYVLQNNAKTDEDALYYLYKNLNELKKDSSHTLQYMLQCGAVAAIESMWQRSENNIKHVPFEFSRGCRDRHISAEDFGQTRSQVQVERAGLSSWHRGDDEPFLDIRILQWE